MIFGIKKKIYNFAHTMHCWLLLQIYLCYLLLVLWSRVTYIPDSFNTMKYILHLFIFCYMGLVDTLINVFILSSQLLRRSPAYLKLLCSGDGSSRGHQVDTDLFRCDLMSFNPTSDAVEPTARRTAHASPTGEM